VFQTYVSSVSSVFRRMLHLDVLKVDWVLHMLQCDLPATAAGGGARGRVGVQTPCGVGWGVDAAWGQAVHRVQVRERGAGASAHPDVRALALPKGFITCHSMRPQN